MNFPRRFVAPDLMAGAPEAQQERPPDVRCQHCEVMVAPVETRRGWFSRGCCEPCRLDIQRRGLAQDQATERIGRMLRAHSGYAGYSLRRVSPLGPRETIAQGLARVQELDEPTLLVHPGNADALKALRHWQPGQSVLLQGNTGRGKTALMLAAVQDHARKYHPKQGACLPVQFWTAKGLMSAVMRANKERRLDEFTDRLLTRAGLWVDDLGMETAAGWQRDVWNNAITDLLNHAASGNGCHVWSTNLTLEEMGERYGAGDRIRSRWMQLTGGRGGVQVGGEDMREHGAGAPRKGE